MANMLRAIYDNNSYADAINPETMGQYGISFKCNPAGGTDDSLKPVTINGILNNSIGWDVNADWGVNGLFADLLGAVAGASPVLAAVNTGIQVSNDLAGRSFTNSGLFTRKFYKNSGDLSIAPSFRVFDFSNTGAPIVAGLLFTSLCLPKRQAGESIEAGEIASELGGIVRYGADEMKKAAEKIKAERTTANKSTGFSDAAIKVAGVISTQTTNIENNLEHTRLNWTTSPSTVDVQIGNWLIMKEMVLTKVSIKYSIEMTHAGPLYADFDLSLVTRENLTYDPAKGTIDQLEMHIGRATGTQASNSSRTKFKSL